MGINKQRDYAQNLMSKRRETSAVGFIIHPIMVNFLAQECMHKSLLPS